MIYNFRDELIRDMVDRNHKPQELIVKNQSGDIAVNEIVCMKCGGPWPCFARRALLDYQQVRRDELQAEVEEIVAKMPPGSWWAR